MRQVADMNHWQGRIDDAEGPAGQRWHQIVQPLESTTHRSGIALIGFACDIGVARNHGRIGASAGPTALRAMLSNLPVQRCRAIVDAGDIVCQNDYGGKDLERAQETLAVAISDLLGRRLLPIALGGGHEIAYGSFSGLARYIATRRSRTATPPRVGVLNLDAHFDLRAGHQANSGTPFRQIAEDCQARQWPFHYCCLGVSDYANTQSLFERAQALGVRWRRDEDMGSAQLEQTLAAVADFIAEVDYIYLTICLDVLPAAIAPGVSAPSARGVTLDVIEPIIDMVTASGKLRIADIAELNPTHDIDHRTARVAARLIARIAERTSTS